MLSFISADAGGRYKPEFRPHQGCDLSVLLPPEGRGALLAGSFTRFRRFAIEQPYRVLPIVGRLSGLSARRSPVEAMRSVVCCADC